VEEARYARQGVVMGILLRRYLARLPGPLFLFDQFGGSNKGLSALLVSLQRR
jgi:hypothetical protein